MSKNSTCFGPFSSWMEERAKTIRRPEDIPLSIAPLRKERDFFEHPRKEDLDFAVTPYYLSLIEEGDEDPIRRQCIPSIEERRVLPWENADPLQDLSHSPVARLVHRYKDRTLLMVTDECAVYCRHCFRRHFSGGRRGGIGTSELSKVTEYLKNHSELSELLLSGGDPLTLSDGKLQRILEEVRKARPGIVIRLASRLPVVLPARINKELTLMLRSFSPVYFVTQFNHPREITEKSAAAAASLVEAGIPVLNQAVLLRGVNDNTAVLGELFRRLVALRVFPYYLLQGDLAAGTSHFRVPLSRGLEIVSELRGNLSGLAMPVYALDLPGGGGKVPLSENYLLGKREGVSPRGGSEKMEFFRFTSVEGGEFEYPEEKVNN
ncbi:MAG: KamA family radical SAM protein [Spirochaetia bacterium]